LTQISLYTWKFYPKNICAFWVLIVDFECIHYCFRQVASAATNQGKTIIPKSHGTQLLFFSLPIWLSSKYIKESIEQYTIIIWNSIYSMWKRTIIHVKNILYLRDLKILNYMILSSLINFWKGYYSQTLNKIDHN
jgi:hypothetical protein